MFCKVCEVMWGLGEVVSFGCKVVKLGYVGLGYKV